MCRVIENMMPPLHATPLFGYGLRSRIHNCSYPIMSRNIEGGRFSDIETVKKPERDYIGLGTPEERGRHDLRPDGFLKTLDDRDVEALRSTRRSIWTGGINGLMGGMLSAMAMWPALRLAEKKKMLGKFKLESKHLTGLVLSLGAISMIIGSIVAGRNSVHELHPVFTKGAKPKYSRYERLQRGLGLESDDDGFGNGAVADEFEELREYGYDVQVKSKIRKGGVNKYGDKVF